MIPDEAIGSGLTRLWRELSLWFTTHTAEILIGIAAGAVIIVLLHFAKRIGAKLCARDKGVTHWATVIGRAIDKTGNFFVIMVAAKLVSEFSRAPDPVASTIDFLFVVAAVFQVAIWVREIILGIVEHRTNTSEYSGEALGSAMGIIRLLVTVAVFAIAIIVVLDNLGVNVTGLVAGLGIGGIAIGLAAQGIFSDLFAALSILFDKPFRRGEAIGFDTSGGTVEQIGLKSTRLRAATGEERIISNANLLNKELINWTRLTYRRHKLALGVVYHTPLETLERIPEIVKAIVEADEQIFVRCGFVNFGASSIDFEVEFDAGPGYDEAYEAKHRVGMAILRRFADEGIEFAYPTQTSFTAAPDGSMIMPYPEVQAVKSVDDEGPSI